MKAMKQKRVYIHNPPFYNRASKLLVKNGVGITNFIPVNLKKECIWHYAAIKLLHVFLMQRLCHSMGLSTPG
jgi:hypothetical protein